MLCPLGWDSVPALPTVQVQQIVCWVQPVARGSVAAVMAAAEFVAERVPVHTVAMEPVRHRVWDR